MRLRVHFIFLVCVAIWCFLLVRAAIIQLLPNDRLENTIKKQYLSHLTINSRRGNITDRQGQELAVSTASYSLYADPKLIDNAKVLAQKLSPLLGYSAAELKLKVKNDQRRFVWLKRHLDFADKERIDSLKLSGIGFIEDAKRIYPNGKLLSQVLGFVGSEGEGLEGLELFYNEELKGQKLKVSLPKDARGRPLMLPHEILVTNPNGQNIELTIDKELQFAMEQELLSAIKKYSADSAWGVMLDPKTSEILAMASLPHFDPNSPNENTQNRNFKNRVLTDVYEPGSTLKTVLVAGALREGIVSPNKTYFCENGKFTIGKRVIREAESSHNFENLTVTDILGHSSNIGAAKIALELGSKKYRKILTDFGLGEKTGVDFQGESPGLLAQLPWNDHLIGSIGFGHGVAVNALQIANAYAAIANGGELHRPYLVKSIRGSSGKYYYQSAPVLLRRVLSQEQADQTTLMLTTVTGPGRTGENARIPGYPIAGKTGTAQKVNPQGRGYLDRSYISSFAGYLPANDPKVVIYIAIDNPKNAYYASQVAAPVFAKIAAQSIRHLGISPANLTEGDVLPGQMAENKSKKPNSLKMAIRPNSMPDLRGLTLREVYRQLNSTNLDISWQGRGTVRETYPAAGASLPASRKVRLVLGFDEKENR